MRKKPTIATVAAQAGVAVSTVSRYLNGRYVSRPVRAKLASIIEELGYSRSWTARNLSLGRRGSIGVVVDSSDDPWFVQLLKGIEQELAARDTSLMLASTEIAGRYEPGAVFSWIRDHRIDGLIVAKAQRRERTLFQAAIDARLPIVAVVPDENVAQAQILHTNNIGAGAIIADHLAALGHRHIAFAGGPSHSTDSKHRLKGLRERLDVLGIGLPADRVHSCDSFEVNAGSAFAEDFLSRPLEVTAIVMANDALAFGFMRVAQRRGIRMPGQLSIAGFDGLPHGELLYPALTTVSQPLTEMGRVACQRLLETIEAPGRIERVEFPMSLLVRESTAPPPNLPPKPRQWRAVP